LDEFETNLFFLDESEVWIFLFMVIKPFRGLEWCQKAGMIQDSSCTIIAKGGLNEEVIEPWTPFTDAVFLGEFKLQDMKRFGYMGLSFLSGEFSTDSRNPVELESKSHRSSPKRIVMIRVYEPSCPAIQPRTAKSQFKRAPRHFEILSSQTITTTSTFDNYDITIAIHLSSRYASLVHLSHHVEKRLARIKTIANYSEKMGALKYVEELQKKKQSDVMRFLLRVRCWEVSFVSFVSPPRSSKKQGVAVEAQIEVQTADI
jgi:hypothetical protein